LSSPVLVPGGRRDSKIVISLEALLPTGDDDMAITAKITRTCPTSGTVYLVPGFLKVRDPQAKLFSGGDEIIVDIMPTNVEKASFSNPIATLHLLEPTDAEFQIPDQNIPNGKHWNYPVAGDKTQIQELIDGEQDNINRGTNSLSFEFPITGLNGRDVTVEVKMTAHPIDVVADSCLWHVSDLGKDTTNIGNKPLDAVM
jgi:hypothetical protein